MPVAEALVQRAVPLEAPVIENHGDVAVHLGWVPFLHNQGTVEPLRHLFP